MVKRRIVADLELAEEMVKVKAGDYYEHKGIKYEIVENREVPNHPRDQEVIIQRGHVLYRTQYAYAYNNETVAVVGFESDFTNDKGEKFVEFYEVESETKVTTEYKLHEDIDDVFPVEMVRDIAKKIVAGNAYVRVTDTYYLVNLVINRKSGEKFEVRVIKEDGSNIETKDIVMIEALLKVLEKVRMLDYTIIFDVKDKKPGLVLKATIGFEKNVDGQKTLFDKDQDPKSAKELLEEIRITNIEEEVIAKEETEDVQEKLVD